MASEFSDSPFGPPKDLQDKELLYPTGDVYKKNEALMTGFNGAVIVVISVLLTILGYQLRFSTHGNYINPQATIAIFLAGFVALRYLAVSALTPLRLFYDKEAGKIIFFKKNFFGLSRKLVDKSAITAVEMHQVDTGASADTSRWELVLHAGAEKYRIPAVSSRVLVRHGAERVARVVNLEIAVTDVDGAETARRKPGAAEDPYYRRLKGAKAPMPRSDIYILKTKVKGGVKYDVSLPMWIASGIFAFALFNLGVGIYIWMVMEKDTARWASIPFLINTFIVFIIAAMVHNLKRTVEISSMGLIFRGNTVPLRRLENLLFQPGFVSRLVIISDTDTLTLLLSRKQLEWLQQELEFEIWNRRPTDKAEANKEA
jgi:hypothetical protein